MCCFTDFVVFCQTTTWISHRYTYVPSLLNLPPYPAPLGWDRAPVWVSWARQQIPVGCLFYMWWCKFPWYSFLTSHPLFPPPPVHKSILFFCFSIAALQINSSVPLHLLLLWLFFPPGWVYMCVAYIYIYIYIYMCREIISIYLLVIHGDI